MSRWIWHDDSVATADDPGRGQHVARIILLNGASSAGKTTLGRALQDHLPEPYLLLGLDTCLHMVPDRWAGGAMGEFRHDGFAYLDLPPHEGHPMLGIGYGPVGWRIMVGFHRAAAELIRAGNPVIVDEMFLDTRVRDDWLTVLAPFGPLLVGVECAVDELDRREATRTDRHGLARWSAARVHAGLDYDLTVDTTSTAPAECAALVAATVETAGSPQPHSE